MTSGTQPKCDSEFASPAYRLEDQIGFILRQASQRHVAIFGELMEANLTPTQFSVINMLARLQTCSQNQLGRLVAMDAATIKGVIARLSAKGLTQAAPDPNDARQFSISLTDAGRELAGEAVEIAKRISELTLEPLTHEEQAILLTLLKKISR